MESMESMESAVSGGQTMLEGALIDTYRSNPALLAQREGVRAEDESLPQALSGWLPSAEFTTSIGRRQSQRSESLSFFGGRKDTTTPRTTQVILRQSLYEGGATVAETRRAQSAILAARAELTATEQDVLLRAATAFLDVVRDQAILDLSRRQEAVLARQLQATSDRFDVGEATIADVSQARARHAGAIADSVRAQGAVRTAKAVYLSIVGTPAGELETPDMMGTVPPSLDAALAGAEQANPRLMVAIHNQEVARSQVKGAHARLLPDISLRAQADYTRSVRVRDGKSHSLEVAADVRVPIYQSGRAMAQLRQSKYRRAQSRRHVENVRREVAAEVESTWQSLVTSRARILALTQEIEANRIALEGVRQEAEVGIRTTLDVLDAEREFYDSRTALVQAERDEMVAGFRIQALIGRFTARKLALSTPIYDPRQHYEQVKYKFWGPGIESQN